MKIEIWSDIVCPWCYIGKRRFETALAQFAHRNEVDVLWRSFELNPDAEHQTGERLTDVLARKFGMNSAQIESMHDKMTALAAAEGLEYHLDDAQPSNTFNAHRLLHLAARHDRQEALKERLMHAYFTEGLSIGERTTLLDLGTAVGLDAEEVRGVLGTDTFAAEVRADEHRAALFGITGVPFFALDETYGISGAQPASHILAVLEQAWAESHEGSPAGISDAAATGEGDACVPTAHRG
jgi:predicted DsbA family dithiol-disulfide isomerase